MAQYVFYFAIVLHEAYSDQLEQVINYNRIHYEIRVLTLVIFRSFSRKKLCKKDYFGEILLRYSVCNAIKNQCTSVQRSLQATRVVKVWIVHQT
jgi:hypothetical protein